MPDGLYHALQELVERISLAVRPEQIVPAYLAGGTATWLHIQKAGRELTDQARYSEDADIHFGRPLVFDRNVVVAYKDAEHQERLLALDGSYSIDIGLRHPDCFEDAEFLFASQNQRIRLYLLSPVDLAVTKTGRFQDHDRMDLELLAKAGLLDSATFRQRAIEALDYLATDPSLVRINIDEAAELIEQATPQMPS